MSSGKENICPVPRSLEALPSICFQLDNLATLSCVELKFCVFFFFFFISTVDLFCLSSLSVPNVNLKANKDADPSRPTLWLIIH